MFSESHKAEYSIINKKLKLIKIHDQLIGGVKTGIPVCYRLGGIRQSSLKSKRSSSIAHFELRLYTRAISVCVQWKFIEALVLETVPQKINLTFLSQHVSTFLMCSFQYYKTVFPVFLVCSKNKFHLCTTLQGKLRWYFCSFWLTDVTCILV